MNNATIAFLGAGNLAYALISGLMNNHYDPKKIWATNPSPAKLKLLSEQMGIQTSENNIRAIEKADIVVLAVKPLHIQNLCEEICPIVHKNKPLIISVASGTSIKLLGEWLKFYKKIVRAMPNTPTMVGSGVTGLYAKEEVSGEEKNQAESIFRASGLSLWLESEDLIDVICAISGCGPGYVFLIMEAIEKIAQDHGLSDAISRLITAQTFLGSARLVLESTQPLADLRRQVASPQGSTEKVIEVLESGDIRKLMAEGINAALVRIAEIAGALSSKQG